jgi:hypothetical protein
LIAEVERQHRSFPVPDFVGKIARRDFDGLGVLSVPEDGPDRSEVPFRLNAVQVPVIV